MEVGKTPLLWGPIVGKGGWKWRDWEIQEGWGDLITEGDGREGLYPPPPGLQSYSSHQVPM